MTISKDGRCNTISRVQIYWFRAWDFVWCYGMYNNECSHSISWFCSNFFWRHTTIILNFLYKGIQCLQAYVDWNVLSPKFMIINTLTWVTTFTPLEIIKAGNHNLLFISIPLFLVSALISSKLIPSQSLLNIISYNDSINLAKAKLNPLILTTFFLSSWLYFPSHVGCQQQPSLFF